MKVLVLNCGSSSVKFLLYEMDGEKKLAGGIVERIGEEKAAFSFTDFTRTEEGRLDGGSTHENAVRRIIAYLLDAGVISDPGEIEGVGHRVVHGGERYTSSVRIDEEVCTTIERLSSLAPLHNPPNLAGIKIARSLLPRAEQVAVFDTAFHQGMEPEAFLYALPYAYYERYGVRRYGFHGTSHRYVFSRMMEIAARRPEEGGRFISAHLGNGCSITAVKDGKVVETSMGFTPLEGLVMGTRSGDLDAGVISFLLSRGEMSADPSAENFVDRVLNKKSGLLGLSGVSNDMREIEERMAEGDERARLAFAVTARRIRKYIAAYSGLLGGLDFLVFTAGIGENSPSMREAATRGLEFMGIVLDERGNREAKGEARIDAGTSSVEVWVLPTKEELYIARDTARVIRGEEERHPPGMRREAENIKKT